MSEEEVQGLGVGRRKGPVAGHICAEPDEATAKASRMSWDGICRDSMEGESIERRME